MNKIKKNMGKINLMGLDSDEDDQNITEVNIIKFNQFLKMNISFIFYLYFFPLFFRSKYAVWGL